MASCVHDFMRSNVLNKCTWREQKCEVSSFFLYSLSSTNHLPVWRPTLYSACTTSAHAMMAPWRVCRSTPVAMVNKRGRTESRETERSGATYFNSKRRPPPLSNSEFPRGLGNRQGDIVYLSPPCNQEPEASGCAALWWPAF